MGTNLTFIVYYITMHFNIRHDIFNLFVLYYKPTFTVLWYLQNVY